MLYDNAQLALVYLHGFHSARSDFFKAAYGITSQGNWEGKTVLQRALDDASLAARFNLDPESAREKLNELHRRLLQVLSSENGQCHLDISSP